MQEYITKAKKYGLYLFAAVGVVALAVMAVSYLSPGTPLSPSSSGSLRNNFERTSPVPSFRSEEAAPAPAGGGIGASNKRAAPEITATEREVIKSGALDLLVKKTEEAADKIKSIAGELGGFVDDANIYEASDQSKTGTVTIKVPADKFDEALKRLKGLAVKVEKEEINATDVTAEFVDLEAHLKNLRAEEEQYLKIMAQASKVDDILNVAEHLSDVRDSIERLEGRIKYLSRQVDMSSIAVSLTEEADVSVFGITWRPLFTVKQAFRGMLEGLAGFVDAVVGFVFFLPVLILWLAAAVAVLWVAWKALRFVKIKVFSAK